MKRIEYVLQLTFTLLFVFLMAPEANGQLLKKLGKAAERAAERTVERRVEKETSEKTDQALDSIFEPGSKGGGQQKTTPPPAQSPTPAPQETGGSGSANQAPQGQGDAKSIAIYSKFDFVPGDEPLFVDDFSNDFVGDFPSRWNTNGSGELVTVDGEAHKWLKILPGFSMTYIPDITPLPDEFTLEFDVMAIGLDNKTSSQSFFGIVIGDNNTFKKSANMGMVEYSFCQFIDPGIIVENKIASKRVIRNDIRADIRNVVKDKHHISIAVNKERFRFWINEKKYIDVPRLLPSNLQMQGIKFTLRGTDPNKESILIGNVKVAKGGVDLRRKLLADGKISTTGILFDSGSARIQPQSMGIIRQIYQVLQQDNSIKLKIVGHTDADGDAGKNLELSKKRAAAVKDALVSVYQVSPNRLSTEGKGETQPVGDNATADGKAQNRRVEFIKL